VLEEAGKTTDELDDRVAAARLESALGERYGRLLHNSTPPTPQASSAHPTPTPTLSSVSGPVSNKRRQ
jgi:hypothetical protein